MGVCNENSKRPKSSDINKKHNSLEQNINDTSKLEYLQRKSFSIIPK